MPGRFDVISRANFGHAAWDGFVRESREGWLFHTSQWLSASGEPADSGRSFLVERDIPMCKRVCQDLSFALVDDSRRALAVVAIRSERFQGLRPIRHPHVCNYRAGIAHADALPAAMRLEVDRAILTEVQRRGERVGAMRVELELASLPPGPDVVSAATLGEAGYSLLSWPSKVIDLTSTEEALFRDYRKGARSAIRKAQREGVTVHAATSPDDVLAYGKLRMLRMSAIGAAPPDPNVVLRIWRALAPKENCEVLLARLASGQPVAGIMTLNYKHSAYYFTAGSDPEQMNSGGNTLLVHAAVMRAKARGQQQFHLGPTPRPEQVNAQMYLVGRFKNQFGGAVVDWRLATLLLWPRLRKIWRVARRAGAALQRAAGGSS